MKILIFSDLHGVPTDDEMSHVTLFDNYAFCVSLGDNPPKAIAKIHNYINQPFYGIAGNHDTWETPEISGISDIHGKIIQHNGLLFTGFGGSHKYKNSELAMMTQSESIKFADTLTKCDVLFSHDTLYGELGSVSDNAHCGLKGISKYVEENGINVNICGHYHVNRSKNSAGGCKILCVYGCVLIDTDDLDNIVQIF